jgi:multidrug efflux system outer membrane protein
VDSNLTFLDAQRSLFSSQQALIVDRLAQLVAEVNLYTALGGAWSVNPLISLTDRSRAPRGNASRDAPRHSSQGSHKR